MYPNIQIFLVEDHPATVAGIQKTLTRVAHGPQFDFLGHATTMAAAQTQLLAIAPDLDLLLLDLGLKDAHRMELLEWVVEKFPNLSVVVFSAEASIELATQCIAKGAKGYICKTVSEEKLIQLLQQLYLDSTIRSIHIDAPEIHPLNQLPKYTPMEMRIIWEVLNEQTNEEIAQAIFDDYEVYRSEWSASIQSALDQWLKSPESTTQRQEVIDGVKILIINKLSKNIFVKANVGNRVGLILYALRVNLFPDFVWSKKIREKESPAHSAPVHKVRVMVVEDHKATLLGLQEGLEASGQIHVVGTATDGVEAETWLYEHHESVEVLLTDYKMPRMDGLELTKKVHARYPKIKVIVLSVENVVKNALLALGEGAAHYLVKDSSTEEITNAILSCTNRQPFAHHVYIGNGQTLFTDELNVLAQIMGGESAANIGRKLKIGQNNAESIIRKLKDKFGVKTTEGLAIAAYHYLLKKH